MWVAIAIGVGFAGVIGSVVTGMLAYHWGWVKALDRYARDYIYATPDGIERNEKGIPKAMLRTTHHFVYDVPEHRIETHGVDEELFLAMMATFESEKKRRLDEAILNLEVFAELKDIPNYFPPGKI